MRAAIIWSCDIGNFYLGTLLISVFNAGLTDLEIDLVFPVARNKARNAELIQERLDRGIEIVPVKIPC